MIERFARLWKKRGLKWAPERQWARPERLWAAARHPEDTFFWVTDSAVAIHMMTLGSSGKGKSNLLWALGGAPSPLPGAKTFEARERRALERDEWELSADEELSERHLLCARAFFNACRHGSKAEQAAAAEQIALRLSGRRSEAPSEEWLEGWLEGDDPVFMEMRALCKARLEAFLIGESAALAPASQGSSRARL